jgi:hypothetical protein
MKWHSWLLVLSFVVAGLGCSSTKPGQGDSSPPPPQKPKDAIVKNSELKGLVETANGQPQAGLHVAMSYNDTPFGSSTQTDANGEFILRNVPRGGFEIEISGSENFEVVKQSVPQHNFEENPSFTLGVIILQGRHTRFTGRVTYTNTLGVEVPIIGAVVALIGTQDETRTNQEGQFVLSSASLLEGTTYVIKIFAGSDFGPEVVALASIAMQEDNQIGTVRLIPYDGVTDPKTRIPVSYRPQDTGGILIQGR